MFRCNGRVPRAAAVAAAVVCAYGAGAVGGTGGGHDAARSSVRADGPVDQVAAELGGRTARRLARGELDRAAIDRMLKGLGDRWAHYYSAREFDDFQGRLNGRYSGVGIWLGMSSDGERPGPAGEPVRSDGGRSEDGDRRVRVASVQPGSAAARAGVRVGDAIVGVGDTPVDGWDVTRVAAALRGRPGTAIELGVVRGRDEYRFRLVRAPVATSDVTVSDLPRHVLAVRVGAFTRGVGAEVREAVGGRPGHRPRGGVLLDLRGNPGGLVDEAVETASAFLSDGLVVTYERRGRPPERRTVTAPGDAAVPLVVLVDGGTASAAEIVAGSLRDRGRAVIVGSRTYGKGSVQEPIRLADGSAIELTVGRYRTPLGRNLDGVGIDPDVAVSADRPPRAAEQRAQAVLRGLLATMPDKDRG
ncbi:MULTISPECIES: S41 family peptidase [Actinomadura]|uniref:S41 family peptidase n=1 Tax=Actinomadura yumaensis TaxID=111807 RepID=A0ABW2CQN4_9ACTN|nr:S41 family peptidase [Actinomadura sp. J1-007]MWK36209.1 PDZ domain-containing protein [Actinomadura sp. J1-007]